MTTDGFKHVQFDTYTKKWKNAYRGISKLKEDFNMEIAKVYLKRLKEVSPVGIEKKPEERRLKNSWKIESIESGRLHHTIHVTNDAYVIRNGEPYYYAIKVEDGHHTKVKKDGTRWWVEGQHMSQIAAQSVRRGVKKRWNNRYKAWLKERGLD